MTIRLDTSRLIPGKIILGVPGLGILGSEIPATGTDGPSVLYNDGLDPNKEYRAFWTTPISGGGGAFFANEDGSFTFTGASDGTYTGEYQHYEDGVAISTPQQVTVTIGAAEATISIIEPIPVFAVSASATMPTAEANIAFSELMPVFSVTASATQGTVRYDVSFSGSLKQSKFSGTINKATFSGHIKTAAFTGAIK